MGYDSFYTLVLIFLAVILKEAVKGNNKGFVKKVEQYLKSDSYMYASLVAPPQSNGNTPPPTKSCFS